MGAPKQKWTAEEVEALIAGINKHGTGKWKNIQKDPEYAHILAARSNIDLKDKWRNMSVSTTGEGSRPKGVKSSTTTPKTPNYMYAISAIFENTASDTYTVSSEISHNLQRHEVPSNFRRLLSSKLRRLVVQDKLEKVKLLSHETKVQAYHKIKKDATFGTKTQTPKPPQEATLLMAQNIAEAENKSFLVNEAVKEAERVEGMAEQSACMKQFFEDVWELCERGEPMIMAF
ncbi:hypothetical protein MKW98_002033 [Papaver atlanticum]|uniref:MYB transcription factor n=1 Tax=Papaver atlanticum TaxID=357466 RepID=A0AAD4SNR5_9MAGN|nr:hypothetical protein MKW98_002033 [Papaver atlanticum]